MPRIRPLNDYIFKKLFGEPETKENLKSLLNAILEKTVKHIDDITIIKDKELTTDIIKDKTGIIDVLAKLDNGTQINIEVQLTDQNNMDKRTLFYWARIYNRTIVKGEKYNELNKVITINILDFNYIKLDKYHTTFSIRENEHKDYKLTDVLEIHFIEMPKFKELEQKDYSDSLQRWLTALRDDSPVSELEEVVKMDNDIKNAMDRLDYLSSDDETMQMYWERERSLHERANLISTGIERGMQQGLQQGLQQGIEQGLQQGIESNKIDNAKNLLSMLDDESIATAIGIDIEVVKQLRQNNN